MTARSSRGSCASDFDQFDPEAPDQGEQILGHSPISLQDAQSTMGARHGHVFSDMTYRVEPGSGAGIFDSGTNNWVPRSRRARNARSRRSPR